MESLKEMFKVGSGPSSSHTIAPQRAVKLYLEKYPQTSYLQVFLYGSLSLTGKGHFTDHAIKLCAEPISCDVFFNLEWQYPFPNGLIIKGYDNCQKEFEEWVVYSIGGGSIKILNQTFDFQKQIYPQTSFAEIKDFCLEHGFSLVDYVMYYEPNIRGYLTDIFHAMINSVSNGLNTTGYLLGPLNMPRVASKIYSQAQNTMTGEQDRIKVMSYAYATMEENATLGQVVTAPTCGASGVMASLMYYYYYDKNIDINKLIDGLMVAGVIGNVIKTNATVSGAEGGCQAEVGAACAMSAAMIMSLSSDDIDKIEYAAEIAMEHHLGLTCDPVAGYVIIPCIERNSAAALRAIDSSLMATTISNVKLNRVSLDQVVATMKYTGQKIAHELRETSLGGLASEIKVPNC